MRTSCSLTSCSWVGASAAAKSLPASTYTYLRPSSPTSERSVPLTTRLRIASLLTPSKSAASRIVTRRVANPSPPTSPPLHWRTSYTLLTVRESLEHESLRHSGLPEVLHVPHLCRIDDIDTNDSPIRASSKLRMLIREQNVFGPDI